LRLLHLTIVVLVVRFLLKTTFSQGCRNIKHRSPTYKDYPGSSMVTNTRAIAGAGRWACAHELAKFNAHVARVRRRATSEARQACCPIAPREPTREGNSRRSFAGRRGVGTDGQASTEFVLMVPFWTKLDQSITRLSAGLTPEKSSEVSSGRSQQQQSM